MISELFVQQLYSVIDIAIIGRYLGAKELGAVGNAANIIMLFLVASGGFEMAVDVMVSRLLGAGKNKEKVAMARDTLFLSAISGLVLVVIAWISLPALYKAVSLPENMVGDALLYGRVYLFALKPDLSWTKIKSILHIALPTIFQQFAITFGATLVQAWVNPFGQEAILDYVAIVKVMNLARIVLVGFAQTLTLMTAQLLAAKTYSAVKAVYRYCSNVSLIYWLVSSALSVIFCQLLAGMFFDPGQNQAAYSFFRVYLYAFVGIQLFSIFKFLNEGLLRSMVLMKEYLYCNLGELALKLAATWLLLTPLQTNAFWSAELGARIICVLGSTILVIKEMQALEAIKHTNLVLDDYSTE
ncbi:MATE family efflux transporter [Lactobacillus delbrueckii]|uniref:MATE family efflux transporter n=1 Tax=Lactobacillus delbrueckii TaxID=1584 RepID=UPI0035CEB8CF